ncbi:hypothetical protein D3C79_817090 [compost metagenome]
MQQRGQFLTEEQQVKGNLASPGHTDQSAALAAYADDTQALVFHFAPSLFGILGIDVQLNHALSTQGLEAVAHGFAPHCQLVISAFSPSPPGWPSLPMDSKSYSPPFSPGWR